MDQNKIDLYTNSNQILLNPRLSDEDKASYFSLAESFPEIQSHFWIATSGSTAAPKLIALSKSAVLCSAQHVNAHLKAAKTDRWILTLPTFHVGGLGVIARATLSNSEVFPLPCWSPLQFISICDESSVTLCSLVPTQLFDILSLNLPAPQSLRACIVGGGSLSERLYLKARELGWPILPSFGMSECSSQIATASLESLEIPDRYPALQILPHIDAEKTAEGLLSIKSPALFTGYLSWQNKEPHFFDPKIGDRFITEDLVELQTIDEMQTLLPLGRCSKSIKVNGELVSLTKLEKQLRDCVDTFEGVDDACIVSLPDERSENKILLFAVGDAEQIVPFHTLFSEKVMPFERPRELYKLDALPRNELGKIREGFLKEIVLSGALKAVPI